MTKDEAREVLAAYDARCRASWLRGMAHAARWFRGVGAFNPITVERPVIEPTTKEVEAFTRLASD